MESPVLTQELSEAKCIVDGRRDSRSYRISRPYPNAVSSLGVTVDFFLKFSELISFTSGRDQLSSRCEHGVVRYLTSSSFSHCSRIMINTFEISDNSMHISHPNSHGFILQSNLMIDLQDFIQY